MKASQKTTCDMEGDVAGILVTLYTGPHTTLPADTTAQLPSAIIFEITISSSRTDTLGL